MYCVSALLLWPKVDIYWEAPPDSLTAAFTAPSLTQFGVTHKPVKSNSAE